MTFTTEIDRHRLREARTASLADVAEPHAAPPAGMARALAPHGLAASPPGPGSARGSATASATGPTDVTAAPGTTASRATSARRGRAPAWAGFVAASIAVHGAAAVALGATDGLARAPEPGPGLVELAVLAPAAEPAPIPRAVASAEPELGAPTRAAAPPRPASPRTAVERPRPRDPSESSPRAQEAASSGAHASATPVEQPGGASAADAGGDLAVPTHGGPADGALGPGGHGAGGAARVGAASAGSARPGEGAGAAPAEPRVDRRAIARAWMEEVSRILLERARRNYPRSALRTGREGTVMLAITVDPAGRIGAVRVDTPSGVEALDTSAVEAVHEVGSVPPPPAVLAWQTRALRMPIVYRIR